MLVVHGSPLSVARVAYDSNIGRFCLSKLEKGGEEPAAVEDVVFMSYGYHILHETSEVVLERGQHFRLGTRTFRFNG